LGAKGIPKDEHPNGVESTEYTNPYFERERRKKVLLRKETGKRLLKRHAFAARSGDAFYPARNQKPQKAIGVNHPTAAKRRAS